VQQAVTILALLSVYYGCAGRHGLQRIAPSAL